MTPVAMRDCSATIRFDMVKRGTPADRRGGTAGYSNDLAAYVAVEDVEDIVSSLLEHFSSWL
jgi:hypothetical protein